MKSPRRHIAGQGLCITLRAAGAVFLLTAGSVRGQLEEETKRTPVPLTAERFAALALAHEDPLAGVREAAEAAWHQVLSDERYLSTPPQGMALPSWMAEMIAWRLPRRLPADGDFAGWAALLEDSDDAILEKISRQLSTPAAKPVAATVAVWLGTFEAPRRQSTALQILAAMQAAEFAPQVADLLTTRSALDVGEIIPALRRISPAQAPELIRQALTKAGVSTKCRIAQVIGNTRAVELGDVIAPLMDSDEPVVRRAVLESLGALCHPRAVEAVIDALHRGESVREALEVTGMLGDPRLCPVLREYLAHPDEGVQREALDAIATARERSLLPDVAALLTPSTAEPLRSHIISLLVAMNAREQWREITTLLEDPAAYGLVLRALAGLNATEAIPAIKAARSRLTSIWEKAAYVNALGTLKAITRQEAVQQWSVILEQLRQNSANDVGSVSDGRINGAEHEMQHLHEALVRLDGVECSPELLRILGTAWMTMFGEPMLTLENLDLLAHPALLAVCLKSDDDPLRLGTVRFLLGYTFAHKQKPREWVPFLIPLLGSEEPETLRLEALDTIHHLGGKEATSALTDILKADGDGLLKGKLLRALRHEAPGLSIEPDVFVQIAANSCAPMEQREAALNLLQRRTLDPEVQKRLLPLLRQDVPAFLRIAAIAALGRPPASGDTAAIMADLLNEPDTDIRRAALEGIVRLRAVHHIDKVAEVLRTETGDKEMRNLAAEALVALQDSRYAGLLQEKGYPFAAITLFSRATSPDEAAQLLWSLRSGDERLRREGLNAFAAMSGLQMDRGLAWFAEGAQHFYDERDRFLFAATMLYSNSPQWRAALPWLGGRSRMERPALPSVPAKARETVEALGLVTVEAAKNGFGDTLAEAGTVSAEIVQSVDWSYRDAAWLEGVAADMGRHADLKQKAAVVQAVAEEARTRHPARRALRTLLWTAVLQPVLWALVLLVYPWWRPAQAMVWTRGVRRWLGFGWVGPLLLHVRWLREWLWRPFRESLVPPGEVVSFDEWTFFDAVRVTAVNGGEPQPALRVLPEINGVAVLRGESGLGKTTLLQALASQSQRPAALLHATGCGSGMLEALRARLPSHARGDLELLRRLVQRGCPDIFVDAVHEALPEVRARLTAEVNALPGARVLLTTQPVDWTPPEGAVEWKLEPLRPQDMAPFLLKQGTAAVEAAGAGSLLERQRTFAARTARFLDDLEALPPESAEAAALRRMLGNPMEAVLAAELLAAGQIPDPDRLLEQRMEHLEDDYAVQWGDPFPSVAFAGHLRHWRASGAPLLRLDDVFARVASFLARHRLLRKSSNGDEAWRFRHDKIMEWFLREAAAPCRNPLAGIPSPEPRAATTGT